MSGGKKSEEVQKKRKKNFRLKGASKRAKRDKEEKEQNKSPKRVGNSSKNKKEQSRLVYEAHIFNLIYFVYYIVYGETKPCERLRSQIKMKKRKIDQKNRHGRDYII